MIVPRKLGLRQGGMDFIVADLVQQDRRPALAALQLRDEVMQALAGCGRNGPVT